MKHKFEDNKMYNVLGSEIKAIGCNSDGVFNEGLKEKLVALKSILKRND